MEGRIDVQFIIHYSAFSILNSSGRQGQADRSSRPSLQGPMHRAGVAHEVRARVRVFREELVRQHVAFQAIAGGAGADEVAGGVGAPTGHRMDVVQRRFHRVEPVPAVYAATAAVAHGCALELSLVFPVEPGHMRYESAAVPHTPL